MRKGGRRNKVARNNGWEFWKKNRRKRQLLIQEALKTLRRINTRKATRAGKLLIRKDSEKILRAARERRRSPFGGRT